MELTAIDRDFLSGDRGEAARMAMSILVQLGEMYGAKRMISVVSSHIDGCSYTAVWDAGLEFAEKLADLGGKVAIPTTLNITSRDIRNWETFCLPADFAEKCARTERAYEQMGCVPTWTCAPYQYGNTPSFGEQVAWAESNAVNYVNSVIGARTERYGDLVDICCALVGRVPELGLHIRENRAASAVYDIRDVTPALLEDPAGFAALGYFVGGDVGMGIPVIDGAPAWVTHEHLKAFSAASAASGSVGLFHVVGHTPEAPTLDAALQGRAPKRTVTLDSATLERALAALSYADAPAGQHIDLVLLGCPHLSYGEMRRLITLFAGRRVAPGVELWVQSNDAVRSLLERTGLTRELERIGIRLMQDSCILNQPVEQWHFHTMVTNSGKMAYYAPGQIHTQVWFRTMLECVEIAVRGAL